MALGFRASGSVLTDDVNCFKNIEKLKDFLHFMEFHVPNFLNIFVENLIWW